jgi:hypothetical protein
MAWFRLVHATRSALEGPDALIKFFLGILVGLLLTPNVVTQAIIFLLQDCLPCPHQRVILCEDD